MPTRRAILAAAGLAALPRTALAGPPAPGRIAGPELAAVLDGLARVDDGDPSRPRIRVVFSPGCPHSLRLFEATRRRRMDASWAWIPYANDDARDRRACQWALDEGTEAALGATMRRAGGSVPDRVMLAQDRAISFRAGRLLWDATGAALGTPSLAYLGAGRTWMAVRGSLDEARVDAMLAEAS